jgi:alkyl sulfatase BDS1-like metallo-beta-lactamase superfamily hydrolase
MKSLIYLTTCFLLSQGAYAADKSASSSPPESSTKSDQQVTLSSLPFNNTEDFKSASQGLIEGDPKLTIKNEKGDTVWSLPDYSFLEKEKAPDTVNPSLWRMARLNMNAGLFKVTDNIYQIRGYDLANMSIIEGKTGLIIIDPLTVTETAKAGLELYYKHRPHLPIAAVIYTHSHVDHYGGIKGIVSESDVKSGKIKILAPEKFLEEAVAENVFAGNAMSRRAIYMYGALLPKGVNGQVDGGLGKSVSVGTVSLIPPTEEIKTSGEKRTIAGVEMEFQMAAHTEAPAEMIIYFPQHKALCSAEVVTHTLHNLYTLRGAQVRDAVSWWKALQYTAETFGGRTDVIFASHHWPMWGGAPIANLLEKQRDTYKFIHDQSLHFLNMGYTMNELPELVKLPPTLSNEWFNRGYYGSVSHDSKAVYQKYIGWYDSNPAHLDPLPPLDTAKKTVEYMGGEAAILSKAKSSYKKGDFRWVAQVLTNVVYANPKNMEARKLQAKAFDQLGYQAESGPWRNEYLMGAYELRNGVPTVPGTKTDSIDVINAMSTEMLLDYLGVRLNAQRANGKNIKGNISFGDSKDKYAVQLNNSVFIYSKGKPHDEPDFTMAIKKQSDFNKIALGQVKMDTAIKEGLLTVNKGQGRLSELIATLDEFPPLFPIVTREMKAEPKTNSATRQLGSINE